MNKKENLRIVIHTLVVGVLLFPNFLLFQVDGMLTNWGMLLYSSTVLVGFYLINLFVLIPKYLAKRSYRKYFLLVTSYLICILIVLVFWIFLTTGTWSALSLTSEIPKLKEVYKLVHPTSLPANFQLVTLMLRFFMILGLSTALELIFIFDRERSLVEKMEKEKAIMDLHFLKNQLNPHFLLNALNNIYSLSLKKSEDTTEGILILSNLLRHILYESGKTQIPIGQEISFIKNYLSLEKLKFGDQPNSPNINLTIEVSDLNFPILPLVLITLVENAFKHGVSLVQPSFILISIVENPTSIAFSVINSIQKRSSTPENLTQKGIGFKNLDRQLELIYPGKFSFSQEIENKIFKTFLTIKK